MENTGILSKLVPGMIATDTAMIALYYPASEEHPEGTDPRRNGYVVYAERWERDPSYDNGPTQAGDWRIEDPIAPGETMLVTSGYWIFAKEA